MTTYVKVGYLDRDGRAKLHALLFGGRTMQISTRDPVILAKVHPLPLTHVWFGMVSISRTPQYKVDSIVLDYDFGAHLLPLAVSCSVQTVFDQASRNHTLYKSLCAELHKIAGDADMIHIQNTSIPHTPLAFGASHGQSGG